MGYIDNLREKGFNGADIHYFSSYFGFKLKVLNPFESTEDSIKRLQLESECSFKGDSLALNGSKKDINKIIDAGKLGLEYTKESYNNLLLKK